MDRQGPWATALLVTAANFPDSDCVSLFISGQTYLNWHHGLTHSLVGVAISGLCLAWLFWLMARRRRPESRFRSFLVMAYLGLCMHCFLDAMISYGMRPWLPFDGSWYYGDVIHVADPWMWILLAVGSVLGGPRRGAGLWIWGVFALATVTLTAIWPTTPTASAWILAACWLGLLGLRRLGVGEGKRPRFAWLSLILVLLYLVALTWMGSVNQQRVQQEFAVSLNGQVQLERMSRNPVLCVPWSHQFILQTKDYLYRFMVNGLSGEVSQAEPLLRNMDDPALVAMRGNPVYRATIQTWQQFARHPFVGRSFVDGEAGQTGQTGQTGQLILGEGRYSWAVEPDWCNLALPLSD